MQSQSSYRKTEYLSSTDSLNFDRLEEQFQDYKKAFSEVESVTEANRCINCYEAPCIQACPTHINIPQFIHRIASGNLEGAAKTILDSNILGHSCALSCPTEVLCEGACVYHRLNHQPISIGRLQRYAVEHSYKNGKNLYTAGSPTGKKIALVGAGPASLACAHELRKQGHETVIFEKDLLPGGLNTHGIAPYKMKSRVSLAEIEQVSKIGVKFEYSMELGRNLNFDELLSQYDAVFLGLGLGPDNLLEIQGMDENDPCLKNRILGAVEFISDLKLQSKKDLEWLKSVSTAIVIGGGNTALDACRELKQIGIPKVILSYRRGENEMSGYKHELKSARQEGVEFLFHTIPTHVCSLGQTSPSSSSAPLQFQVFLGRTEVHSSGRVSLVKQEESKIKSTHSITTGLMLLATGQAKLESLFSTHKDLQFIRGRLRVDPETGQTGNPKVFAGGDLTNGGKEVVNAVAEGKRAAKAIHERLLHG